MKKYGMIFAVAMVIGSVAMTSCSSKEARMDEPAISGSTATPSDVVASDSTGSANLGSSSSGQGR